MFANIDWIAKSKKLDLRVDNIIGAKLVHSGAQSMISKYSPRDGTLLYQLGAGEAKDVSVAVDNAKVAYEDGRWSQLPVLQRKSVLNQLANLLEANLAELALLESLDVGKPIAQALAQDIPGSIATIRYFAEAADKYYGKAFTDGSGLSLNFQARSAVGVVAGIIGWNFPLLLAAMKVAPALAMGNSIILKPSEFTSLSAQRFAALAIEAGVPPGVFNVVHGAGKTVGAALAQHADIGLLTFTGSTATGKQMMISAGNSNMKRLLLECGGKSPYIVFDDCPDDLDFIASHIIQCAFQNQGEVCSAGTRLLLHVGIKDRLLPKIIEQAAALKPQDPLLSGTNCGALITASHLKKVLQYVESGKQQGATLVYGGERAVSQLEGYYLGPTIFDNVNPSQTIAQEEIFGPVLSVMTFRDDDEALAIANNSPYGLAAYLCTTNISRAQRIGRGVNAGHISVIASANPGDGGVALGGEAYKESGFGCEGGVDGLASYSICRSTHILA